MAFSLFSWKFHFFKYWYKCICNYWLFLFIRRAIWVVRLQICDFLARYLFIVISFLWIWRTGVARVACFSLRCMGLRFLRPCQCHSRRKIDADELPFGARFAKGPFRNSKAIRSRWLSETFRIRDGRFLPDLPYSAYDSERAERFSGEYSFKTAVRPMYYPFR